MRTRPDHDYPVLFLFMAPFVFSLFFNYIYGIILAGLYYRICTYIGIMDMHYLLPYKPKCLQ